MKVVSKNINDCIPIWTSTIFSYPVVDLIILDSLSINILSLNNGYKKENLTPRRDITPSPINEDHSKIARVIPR